MVNPGKSYRGRGRSGFKGNNKNPGRTKIRKTGPTIDSPQTSRRAPPTMHY